MRFALYALLILGCDSNTPINGSNPDLAKPADLAGPPSSCGHPGDPINSKGVGGYCTHISDCTGSANICTVLGNVPTPSADDTYFCTIYPCTPDAGVNDNCGESASCVCSAGSGGAAGCACTPKSCQH